MAEVSFSEKAYDDLEEIDLYTLETWGAAQRDRYLSWLFKHMDAIAQRPAIGKRRPELGDCVMSSPCGSHVIYYELRNDECHVVRVLHELRDETLAFQGPNKVPSRVSEAVAAYMPALG